MTMHFGAAPVYVVIVNFNGWADTIEFLESVLRSDYPRIHVIVVDNGSKDGSVEKLTAWAKGELQHTATSSAPGNLAGPPVPKPVSHAVVASDALEPLTRGALPAITFISHPRNLGFAGGNNIALRWLAKGREKDGYVCLLNNDMVVAPTTVSALVRELERDPGVAAVGGLILEYDQPEMVQAVGGGSASRWHGMTRVNGAGARRSAVAAPRTLGYISGGCLLVRLRTLREIGVMDERYFLYSEDSDWGERMRAGGFRLGCTVDAPVWHKGSKTTGAGSPFQDYHIVLSSLRFVGRHAPARLPVAAAYSVVRCLLPKLARGQWARARAVLEAYRDYALRRSPAASTNGR